MINNGESGISCQECGYEEKALTKAAASDLKERLEWVNEDPVCPACTHIVWFEDYID